MDYLLMKGFGAAAFIYFLLKYCQSYWKRRGILHEKPRLLWGNLRGVGRKRHIASAISTVYKKFQASDAPPFVGFYALLKPLVLVLDLDLVQRILRTDARHFGGAGEPLAYTCLTPLLESADWRALDNNLLRLHDNPERMAELQAAMLRGVEHFSAELDKLAACDYDVLDVCHLADAYNKQICERLGLAYSISIAQTKRCQLLQAYAALQFPWLWRCLLRRQLANIDPGRLRYARYVGLVGERLRESSVVLFDTLLQLLADALPQRVGAERSIAAQTHAYLLAMLATCNSTLTFCLYELALLPEIQSRARAEIQTVLRRHDGRVSVSSLGELQYLRQVLHETLRKHSPHTFLLRETLHDYEIANSVFMLRKDNQLIIPTAAIHHDDRLYPQPEKFDPERFTGAAMEKRHPMAWLPFGCGPGDYPARQQLVETQLLLCLATLLQKFEFSPVQETPIPLRYDSSQLLLAPKGKVILRLKPT